MIMQTDLFGNIIDKPLMALKLKQPFLALMEYGKIETRTWDTSVRGKVMLASSLKPYTRLEMADFCNDAMYEHIQATIENSTLVNLLGQAALIGDLVHVRKMLRADEQKCFVNYNPRFFCHIYENIQLIKPFLYVPRGIQKWKKVDEPEILQKIEYL